jgi:hypothetical protein
MIVDFIIIHVIIDWESLPVLLISRTAMFNFTHYRNILFLACVIFKISQFIINKVIDGHHFSLYVGELTTVFLTIGSVLVRSKSGDVIYM